MEFTTIMSKRIDFLSWKVKKHGKEVSKETTDEGVITRYIFKHRRVEILEVENRPMRVQYGQLIKVRHENN